MAHKKRRPKRKGASALPSKLVAGLQEAETLVRRKRWDEARDVLQALDRQLPKRKEVLLALAHVSLKLGDTRTWQDVSERLLALAPNSADGTFMLAQAYLANNRLFLALPTLQRFLERWPEHPDAATIRQTAAKVEAETQSILHDKGLSGEEGRELCRLQDELLCHLEAFRLVPARQAAERLLSRWPDCIPARNNLAEIHFREGRLDQAQGEARRVLDADPNNVHALANLTRYLFLGGQPEEARALMDRLRVLPSDAPERWVKKAEALACLGDDQGVLDVLEAATQAGRLDDYPSNALLYHLAGAAACRLGREAEAKQHWKKALALQPGFTPARDNLKDLDRPPQERHAPWMIPLPSWIPEAAITGLLHRLKPTARPGGDEAVAQATRQYLRDYPGLASLIGPMLDRGDPEARDFALRLALMAETPEALAALRDFALGQRGPDEMRMEAAQAAMRGGLLPSGPVRMWLRGEWADTLQFGFELHGEPLNVLPPDIEPLLVKALEALNQGKAAKGEELLRKALERAPGTPSLLNNLAAAYAQQGREAEAEAILRDLHRRHPDYLFARTSLAKFHILAGELDEARALLDPLLTRRRMHFSEFASLCSAEIDLALARGEREAARSWLGLWEQATPDHPHLPLVRRQVRGRGWFGWGS
jgi:predicted Zn-dependent protease